MATLDGVSDDSSPTDGSGRHGDNEARTEPARAAGSGPAAPSGADATHPGADRGSTLPPLWRVITVYTAIRLGIVIALTALIWFAGRPMGLPPIIALAFAMVLQLPLSVALFRKQRSDLTAALARAKENRTRERDRLYSELTGHDPLD